MSYYATLYLLYYDNFNSENSLSLLYNCNSQHWLTLKIDSKPMEFYHGYIISYKGHNAVKIRITYDILFTNYNDTTGSLVKKTESV